MGAQALKLVFAAALVAAAALRAEDSPKSPIKIRELRQGGIIAVEGENTDPDAVRWVNLSFASAVNVDANPPLPAGFTLQPLERRTLFTLQPSGLGGYAYRLDETSGEGDPQREPDRDAVYLLPFAHGTKHLVTQGYFGKATHQGLYALDFEMPDGTEVDAARDGTVIEVRQDSGEGGMAAAFIGKDNFIKVMHADATWAVYAHLSKNGVLVQKGQGVKAGQPIAWSGHTGLASGPHLHFAVYRATYDGPKTIPTVFRTGVSATASIEELRTYYSFHPGGAPFKAVLGAEISDSDYQGVTHPARGTDVHLRQEQVDRRVFVWADNPEARPVEMVVDFAQAEGVRASTALPKTVHVPAGTEVYCFSVDYIGDGPSAFSLSGKWRGTAETAP
jgi:murein DD-endopeptidase MepM/ murein hydrolase activator NlpD